LSIFTSFHVISNSRWRTSNPRALPTGTFQDGNVSDQDSLIISDSHHHLGLKTKEIRETHAIA
jgi:hypothetical protein